MADLPTVVTSAGLQPIPPADILAQLIADVTSTNPGYTANLPLSLVEDISSTDVAAISLCDRARIDAVNSLTPFGANAFLLSQLGNMFGIQPGLATNTSVFMLFTGTPGFVIDPGFTVGDGTYQYIIQDGGIIGTDRGDGLGVSALLFAVATSIGSWAVASGTVQTIATSVPNTITLTCTNPQAGIPSTTAETEESYRARVINAMLAVAGGNTTMLKTLVGNVSGVQQRLISVIQLPTNGGFEIIVGGGDPYQVGNAIVQSGINIGSLVGSTIQVTGYTRANPGVITTNLNHGLTNGQTATVSGATPSGFNSSGTVTVVDEKTFSIGLNSSGFGSAYASGGVVSPNNRNISVSINDFPDTYTIPYVTPPQQTVTVALTWNTSLPNFVQASAMAQAGAPAIAAYINSIVVGQPINVFQLEDAFKAAVANIIDPDLITRMVFSVSINGVSTAPTSGTGIIVGDPESYFLTSSSSVIITQG